MIEPIQDMLQLVGTEFTFGVNKIFGLQGFLNDTLYAAEYEVNAQNFNFQVSTYDAARLTLQVGSVFTFIDTTYTYTFKIKTSPIHDLTGMTEFFASYVSKASL